MWQLHIQKGAESVEMCRNGGRRQQRSSRFDEAHELATAGGLFVIDEHDQIVLNEGGLEEREDNFDRDFVLSMLKKIDWAAFHQGAADVEDDVR